MRREVSYQVLVEVLHHDRHAHLVLKECDLDEQDQAFVSALVYTVLQNLYYLRYQFEDLMKRKPNKKIELIFLMASAQAFMMDEIPDYALVNEYVSLTKKVNEKHSAGFVNAVLKKMLSRGEKPLDTSSLEGVSIKTSMPLWILNLLKHQYSEDFAIEYAYYVQSVKPTYGWVNRLKVDQVDEKYFNQKNPHIVEPIIFRSDVLEEAKVVIQDINSKDVVDTMPLEKGMNVLDCCCAPGTKTLRIANLMENTGQILGVELHESRVKVTQDLMKRAKVTNASIIQGDAQDIQFDENFDLALIDAPCSGLGVLAHKHDLRYHIKPEDLDDLEVLQMNILDNISKYIKIDGVLVYATCTLNKKENEKQIEKFLRKHENFALIYEKTYHPMETLGDGFYVAHCQKRW